MARRQSLVLQHLENISRAALEEHQDIIRQHARADNTTTIAGRIAHRSRYMPKALGGCADYTRSL